MLLKEDSRNTGRFLVGLREVQNSERILKFRSLLKIGHDFLTEASPNDQDEPKILLNCWSVKPISFWLLYLAIA